MKNKKTILIVSLILLALIIYVFFANYRAEYYSKISRETPSTNEKILNLEKSYALWKKRDNILQLVDLYVSIGRDDLAEEIMVGRGEVDILNKLGNLYLTQNKIEEAENTFIKAKSKSPNSTSIKGLILVELKKGNRGVAESYLSQLAGLDPDSSSCYGAFVDLNDYNNAKNSFEKAKSCNLYGMYKYFASFREDQNPLYLKLEAANKYYSENYLNLAEKDALDVLREKENYRDAHVLASKIYEKLGDPAKSSEHKNRAQQIDPTTQIQ